MHSQKPDPKDFKSYDDYRIALEMHQSFLEKAEEASGAIQNSQTDEEMKVAMENLGFHYHEDEYCNGGYCNKNETCLLIQLNDITETFNQYFFGNLLPEEMQIITPNMNSNYLEGQEFCGLPKEWNTQGTREYSSIIWFSNLYDYFISENIKDVPFVELANNDEYHEFFRSLYLWFHAVLYKQKIDNSWKKEIENLLNNNDCLHKKASLVFFKKFKKL